MQKTYIRVYDSTISRNAKGECNTDAWAMNTTKKNRASISQDLALYLALQPRTLKLLPMLPPIAEDAVSAKHVSMGRILSTPRTCRHRLSVNGISILREREWHIICNSIANFEQAFSPLP
ncbi:MAG: hypothetical protein QXF17_04640 [Ignisphaera sp.]|uniref:Uncharacterized protein n=1 Tax=Ignisphaera aggregans TaxID=334771 RepID=A0A7J3JSA5_9CREN